MIPLRIPEPLQLSEWAELHFYLSAESSYVEQKWKAIPWQVAIMNAISNDDIRVINWIKSARVGATKIMLAGSAYFAHHKQRNQIFYQPTNDDAEDFCKTEVDTMLRDVKCMFEVFPDLGKKTKNNTQKLKQFIGSSLRIRGGGAATNYRRISADNVWLDELESFANDVQGEGSPVLLADKRLEGALFPKSVRMTTPRLKLGSLIDQEVAISEHLFKYHVPCPHCHKEQILKWGGKDCSFGFKWDDEKPDTCFYMCEHEDCHAVIHNNDLSEMNEKGVWRDENSGVWIDDDDFFRDSAGGYISTPVNISFHIWTAYSPFVRWSQFVGEFIIAKNKVKKDGDTTKLKTFINTTLGETWEDMSDADKMDSNILYNRREHYPKEGFCKRGLVLTAGLDMQDDRIEGEVRAYGLNNENWLVDYFIIRGDPAQPEIWNALERQMVKTYKREDGQELPISRSCFDSGGHFMTEVYDFSIRMGTHIVIPTKGASVYGQPLYKMPKKLNDQGVFLTIIGTDTAKDVIYNRLKLTTDNFDEPISGFYHFPIADWCDKNYFIQLCTEYKVLKKSRGKLMMVYDAGSRRNEPIDCAVGSYAAFKICINEYYLNLESLAEKVAYPERITSSKASFMDAAKKLRVN